jgi:hypothetical protein
MHLKSAQTAPVMSDRQEPGRLSAADHEWWGAVEIREFIDTSPERYPRTGGEPGAEVPKVASRADMGPGARSPEG